MFYPRQSLVEKNGETGSIIYARSREIPETGLRQKFAGEPARRPLEVFSTENENAFADFNPQLKQTGVFIDRFFILFAQL